MAENKENNKNPKNLKPSSGNSDPNKPKSKFNVYWVYGIIAVVFIGLQLLSFSPKPKEITMQEFEREMLKNGDVEKIVVINKERANIYIKQDRLSNERYKNLFDETFSRTPKEGPHFYFTIGSMEYFEKWISEAQKKYLNGEYIEISYKNNCISAFLKQNLYL